MLIRKNEKNEDFDQKFPKFHSFSVFKVVHNRNFKTSLRKNELYVGYDNEFERPETYIDIYIC